MITFISGAPGTGKSAALVSMLEVLGKDRVIYVHGIPDLKIDHQVLVDPAEWHNVVPDGSVIVVDEAQNFLRPNGPGQKLPEYIAAHETHRHRGLDIYYISQGPNLLHANIRALIGRHVHLRDLGVLGRWWYEWPECADNCRTAWKNAPIKKRYRLPKHVFSKYKSSSLHVKPIRSFPWMLVVLVAALVGVGVLSWRAYSTIAGKIAPTKLAVPAAPAGASVGAGGAAGSGPKVLDDRVDWIPRISSRPETAPAFDELRKVVNMPRIVGAIVMGKRVRCVTQQGTDVGVTEAECRAWMANPPFDAYTPLEARQAVAPSPGEKNASEAASAPSAVLMQDQGRAVAPSAKSRASS